MTMRLFKGRSRRKSLRRPSLSAGLPKFSLLISSFNATAASSQMAAELEKAVCDATRVSDKDSCVAGSLSPRCPAPVSRCSFSNSANGFPLCFACSTALAVFFAVYFRS